MRSIRLFLSLCILLSVFTSMSFAQNAPQHESEHTQSTFPALPLEPEIFNFPDPDFVRVALKIQLGTASIQERRAWYRAAERYAPFQDVPPPDWKVRAAQDAAALEVADSIYNWTSMGPNGDYLVSGQWGPPGALDQGRATAVWTDIEGTTVINKNIIFLGFADGGVWKTIDGGENWEPLTDHQPTIAIGALDVLPGNDRVNYTDAVIYAGTGEGNFSQPDKDGVGVLKSVDGGKTWQVQQIPWRTDEVGFAGSHRIRRLRIDRNIPNAQSVWIAADGGVYHTSDGGTTWQLVTGLPYAGAPADAAYPGGCWNEYPTDFVINTADVVNGNSTLLAAYGNFRDNACASVPADSRKNNGIYRSVDGGATWQKITISGANGFPEIPGDVGRIALLSAPSNPKHIYVLIAKASNFNSLGIWDTLDSNASPVQWTAGSTTNFVGSQGWYDITGAVDPTNENKLIVGGIDNWLSTNRGATITRVSQWNGSTEAWAHADHHHAIWVDANTYYDANDGGLNIGHINGTTVRWSHRNGGKLSTLQFYGLSQSAQSPYKINAGLQDNGHAYFDGNQWRATYGGDGGFAATDQTNELEAYEEYVYASIRNSSDGGLSWPLEDCMQAFGQCTGCLGACVPDNHTAFIANFMLDVHNQSIMYVGTNYLYRNLDAPSAGKIWQRITSDGVNGDFVNGATSSRAYISIVHTPNSSPVAEILPGGPKISQIIYVGTSTGRIWKTTNGGQTWVDLTKNPLPVNSPTTGRFLTWIDTDPNDADKVVITYSGWSNSTIPAIPGHVFRSTDGGQTWTDISGALPDEPFNSIAVNPNDGKTNEIYAASDTSVYVNTNGWSGDRWIRTNSGLLPSVSVNMLQFTNATEPKRLRAASHGRGIWELFNECEAKITLDRPSYTCSDTIQITLQDNIGGATTQTVNVFSNAETTPETITLSEDPPGSGRYVGAIQTTSSAAASDGKISVLNADTVTVRYADATPCPGGSSTIEATTTTNCSTCDGSTAAGPNMEITSQADLTMLSGDGDAFVDNCENGRIAFTLRNNGGGNLTNVRISKVTPSHSAVQVQNMPVQIAPSLAQCGSANAAFTFTAGGLSTNETLDLLIEVTSDELAALGVTRQLTARYEGTEQDIAFNESHTFTFENGMDGWTVVNGIFARTDTGGGAQNSSHYLASSAAQDDACDIVRSPVIRLTEQSTLSVFNQFEIEGQSPDANNEIVWWDRGNVGIFDVASGSRTTISPSGGRLYNASGANGVCAVQSQPAWAFLGSGWMESTWTSEDLQASSFAEKDVQIDVTYGTDTTLALLGLWIDHVTVTNFYAPGPDSQPDDCRTCDESIEDTHESVEYFGGWHQKSDSAASGGTYHVRTGNKNGGNLPHTRLVFDGTGVTYFYAVSKTGGTADIYIDGVKRQTLSYSSTSTKPQFGKSVSFTGLPAGSHELKIVHASGAVYVDAFRIDCGGSGSGADATAVQYRSETKTDSAAFSEGAVVQRVVELGADDVELSVVVEGSTLPMSVKLLDSAGNLVASGSALLSGFSISGLDAAVPNPGTYIIQIANTLSPGQTVQISTARTIRTP